MQVKRISSFERCISAFSWAKKKNKPHPGKYEKPEMKRGLTWQFSQHSPCAHMEPAFSLHVSGSQQSLVHSCERISNESSGTVLQGLVPSARGSQRTIPYSVTKRGQDILDLRFACLTTIFTRSRASHCEGAHKEYKVCLIMKVLIEAVWETCLFLPGWFRMYDFSLFSVPLSTLHDKPCKCLPLRSSHAL